MYEKVPYTPGMREVIKFSISEARRLKHDYIRPEHYLLGILRKGDGLAVQILINLQIPLADIKRELEGMIPPGRKRRAADCRPNDDAKRVLDRIKEVSRAMQHNWIGTEHLIIGIIKEEQTIACQCLRKMGLTSEMVEAEALNVIAGPQISGGQVYGRKARQAEARISGAVLAISASIGCLLISHAVRNAPLLGFTSATQIFLLQLSLSILLGVLVFFTYGSLRRLEEMVRLNKLLAEYSKHVNDEPRP